MIEDLIGPHDAEPVTGECRYSGEQATFSVKVESQGTVAAADEFLAGLAGEDSEVALAGDEAYYLTDSTITGRKGIYIFGVQTTRTDAKVELLPLAQEAANNLPAPQ
jgi:hypothetical protein